MVKILIVDDEENVRFCLSKLLEQNGYEVMTAADGYAALRILAGKPFDLVITDINMPEMDGIEFLAEISRHFSHLKVIMVTAYGKVESYLDAMNLGALEYLNKPLQLDELLTVIKSLFRTDQSPLAEPKISAAPL